MTKERPMEVFGELIRYEPGLLEKPLKELLPISFVGAAAVTAYRSLVGKLDSLPMTQEQKEKTLRDGQDAGKMLLAIEGRIGELLPSVEVTRRSGTKKILPDGVTDKTAYKSRSIAEHPKVVDEVIAEAEENEDIPTKTAVLNKIAYKEEKKAKEQLEQNEGIMNDDARRYLAAIRRAYTLIEKPPKSITEEAFQSIKRELKRLKKRIEEIIG